LPGDQVCKQMVFQVFNSLLFALLMMFSTSLQASERIALVIGNGAYDFGTLTNPANDARDVAKVLEKLGFKILLSIDATKGGMLDALDSFAGQLHKADAGVFYFAGHGMQINGRNYLLPVMARLKRSIDVEYEALSADRVLATMQDSGSRINILILDACRDNPFRSRFRSASRGLAMMQGGHGSFIAYATSPGSVAADGRGRNGVFTAHLLKNIETPGLPIEEVFKRTRFGVVQATKTLQIPWQTSSLMGNFYFAAPLPAPSQTQAASTLQSTQKNTLPEETLKQKGIMVGMGSRPIKEPAETRIAGERIDGPLPGMKFAWIPPGTFMMGSPASEKGRQDDEKQHKVTLTKGGWLMTTEITVGQWRAFAQATGYKSEAETGGGSYIWDGKKWEKKAGVFWDKPGFEQMERHPVTCVSWHDAQAFIRWLNRKGGGHYDLPTEAQWEYAARAGSPNARFWGDDSDRACEFANVAGKEAKKRFSGGKFHECTDGWVYTSPVSSFKANSYGLYDMIGNVWEWCADWYGKYPDSAVTDPTGPTSGARRVLRGGSWNYRLRLCRSADRYGTHPGNRGSSFGFRLARIPE